MFAIGKHRLRHDAVIVKLDQLLRGQASQPGLSKLVCVGWRHAVVVHAHELGQAANTNPKLTHLAHVT